MFTVFYQNEYYMISTTASEFRKNVKYYFDQVSNHVETLLINRGKGRGVVIISLDEYNSLKAACRKMASITTERRLDSTVEKYIEDPFFDRELLNE